MTRASVIPYKEKKRTFHQISTSFPSHAMTSLVSIIGGSLYLGGYTTLYNCYSQGNHSTRDAVTEFNLVTVKTLAIF